MVGWVKCWCLVRRCFGAMGTQVWGIYKFILCLTYVVQLWDNKRVETI
jgi:hypothetical protein